MHDLAFLLSLLVIAPVPAQQSGGCLTPPPVPTFTCVNGGWVPTASPPAPAPPAPPPPVYVISVGETVTGALLRAHVDSTGFHPEVFAIHYELTAPSDGFLTVQLNDDPPFGCVDWVLEDVGGSLLPTTEVIAGRTYRVVVFSSCWDEYPRFVLTTSISLEAPVPVIPCRGFQPGFGWLCINGGWVPPTHPLAQAPPAPPTLPVLAPPVAGPVNCLSGPPAAAWVCVNGGWVPPDHPLAISASTNPLPTSPPTQSGACTTPDPFIGIPGLFGVCVAGGWVPMGHPLAGGGG